MKKFHLDDYIITVGYSSSEEITSKVLDNILDFCSISYAVSANKAIYCYNLDTYKTFKGIKPDNSIIKDTNIIGIIGEDLVITFENLLVSKEFVCKISKSIDEYDI